MGVVEGHKPSFLGCRHSGMEGEVRLNLSSLEDFLEITYHLWKYSLYSQSESSWTVGLLVLPSYCPYHWTAKSLENMVC